MIKLNSNFYQWILSDQNIGRNCLQMLLSMFLSRAYGRIGNVYFAQKEYTKALNSYNDSLSETQTPAIRKKRDETKKILKEIEAQEYLDPEKAEEERQKGNELFKNGNIVS